MDLFDPYPQPTVHTAHTALDVGAARLAEAFALMATGIPLSLLLDLALADPHSHEVFSAETPDLSWLAA